MEYEIKIEPYKGSSRSSMIFQDNFGNNYLASVVNLDVGRNEPETFELVKGLALMAIRLEKVDKEKPFTIKPFRGILQEK